MHHQPDSSRVIALGLAAQVAAIAWQAVWHAVAAVNTRISAETALLADEAASNVGVLMVLFGAGRQLVRDLGGGNQAKVMAGIGGLLEAVGAGWITGSHTLKRPVDRTAYVLYGTGFLVVAASLLLGRRASSQRSYG